jgi:holin-like protein
VRLVIGIAVVWLFLLAGQGLGDLLELPLPGSVLGMLLLWAALEAGVVRLAWIDRGAGALLAILGLLFVPAGVGVIEYADAGAVWLGVGAVIVGGVLITLAVTGFVVQRVLGRA